MRVIVEIDCDGDAFQGTLNEEVARTLASFSRAILVDGLEPEMVGLDINGNRCASLRVEP